MKSKKKLIIKIVASILAIILFISAYYAVVLWAGFLRLKDNIAISPRGKGGPKAPLGEVLTVMTYNVGFGAYSDDYSFFMDGGEHSRAFSKEAVIKNISASVELAQKVDPDFLFLQEVDIYGTRSHYVDQTQFFKDAYESYDRIEAVNYDSPYLLYPFDEPIGKNKSCIMTFSRYNVKDGTRRSLPVESFPNNLRVSIPAFFRVPTSSLPKVSSPTLPSRAVERPYLVRAARKLAGAPPGWAAMVG